jgi:hypothetical protein
MVSKGDNCLVANTFVRISVGDLPSLSHHVLQILQIRGRGIIKNSAKLLFVKSYYTQIGVFKVFNENQTK